MRARRLGPAKKEFARVRLRGWFLNLHVCGVYVCGLRGCTTPSFILMKRILFHFLVLSGKQTSA